jgi:outer membrane protein W
MKNITRFTVLMALTSLALPGLVHAENVSRGFVHLGVADIALIDKGVVYADGVPLTGATYSSNHTTPLVIEGGYFVTPTLAVQGSIGSKETTRNMPGGTLAGYPNLANDSFEIATLTLICHPWHAHPFMGAVSPYAGFGLGFQSADGAEDGLVTHFKVKNTDGLALQAGSDVKINTSAAIYVDVKKAFYTARASGDLGPSHLISSARLDPVMLQTGLLLSF